uniref:Uncharacterized protein n=1 Tax=Panagrolaimus davidi TaxID=227884 RepID=A0A914QW27_9BILA
MYVIRNVQGKSHRMHANQIYKRHIPVSYDFDLNGTPSVTSDDTQSVTSSTSTVSQRGTATTPRRSSPTPPYSTPSSSHSSPAGQRRTSPRVQPTPTPTALRRSLRTRNAPDRLRVNPSLKSYTSGN